MKKICWVVASPLTVKFFLEQQIEALAKEYDLTLITNKYDSSLLPSLAISVRVISVKIERNVSLKSDLRALLILLQIFHREKFDLVHTLSPKTGLLGIIAAWVMRVPVRIHVFQGEVWATRKGLWRIFLKNLDRLIVCCATDLLVVSKSEEMFLIKQKIVTEGKLKMLGNGSICGVDSNRFQPNLATRKKIRSIYGILDDDVVLLYVGRLANDKGLIDLANAFVGLAPQYPAMRLMIVGPDEDNLRLKISECCSEILERVYFSEFTPNPEHFMTASDILCLPSYREGFGMVLIEAASVGIPSIGSRIYGIQDAIQDGRTGLLFMVGDVTDLTNKIKLLLDNPRYARELGEKGRIRAQQDFSKELILKELLKFYKNILAC